MKPQTFWGQDLKHAPKFIFRVGTFSKHRWDWLTLKKSEFSWEATKLEIWPPACQTQEDTKTSPSCLSGGVLKAMSAPQFQNIFCGTETRYAGVGTGLHSSGAFLLFWPLCLCLPLVCRVSQTSLLSRLLMSHACSVAQLWHSLNLQEERQNRGEKGVLKTLA